MIERLPTHESMKRCADSGVEHIVAAAVRDGIGKVWSLTWPCRHGHVMQAIHQAYAEHRPREEREAQGFMTSTGRFVGRIEAADIAIRSGQIPKLNWPPELFSEDLW